jgi:hypothetical protein
MSTAYPLRWTLPLSFKPRAIESSYRYLRTVAMVAAVAAVVVALITALPSAHVESPATNVHACSYAANHPRLAVERDWHTHALPTLNVTGCSY